MENQHPQAKQFKVHTALDSHSASKLRQYQDLVLGRRNIGALVKYELVNLFVSSLPGALGIFLRSKLYPSILGHVGKNVIFGRNTFFRHPHKIHIGDNCIVDDNCLLDAKGSSNTGITLGDSVFLGRNTILSCKDGDITLEDNVNIGFNCVIFSSSTVILEEYALLAAYCYVVGGGNYNLEKTGLPIAEQPVFEHSGVVLEKNCWLGSGVNVLDGARIGHDSAVGASSLVNSEIPPFSIAVGTPAVVVKERV